MYSSPAILSNSAVYIFVCAHYTASLRDRQAANIDSFLYFLYSIDMSRSSSVTVPSFPVNPLQRIGFEARLFTRQSISDPETNANTGKQVLVASLAAVTFVAVGVWGGSHYDTVDPQTINSRLDDDTN